MASTNSKKVNDNKRKENKEELAKDRTWKVVGAFDNVDLNYLKTKSESRREKKDVELKWMSLIWRRMRDKKWDRNWQSVREFVNFKV